VTHLKVIKKEGLLGIDQSTETRKRIAAKIVMMMIMTRKMMRIKLMLMVKLREKVFTTIPCPVFLMEFKVGDFYFSFYGSLF